MKKWIYFTLTLVIAGVLAFLASTPPPPKDASAPLDTFSAARAMEDVRIIAAAPHPTGSAENAKVRAFLEQRMKTLGMDVTVSESQLGDRALQRLNRWSGEAKTSQAIFNVIGVLPGKDRSKPALLLMAHHDTVWGSPGAADDTIGIASIFEIIRVLNEDGQPERDLIVLLTDGEELGLSGARNFFKDNPLHESIGAVINFEARGGGGTSNMFQTSAQNGEVAALYARAVRQPSTSSLSVFVYSVLPNDSDLTPALKEDYAAYNIAHIGAAKYYHSPKIDADALSEGTLQHMGSQGLDLTRALLAADTFPVAKEDAVFFDVFGLFTVIYAPFWGWIFLALSGLYYALSVDRKSPKTQVLGGTIRMLAFLTLGGLLLFLLNKISGNLSGANYYDRLADIPRLEIMAFLSCIAMFFVVFGRAPLSPNTRLGAALPILVIGIGLHLFAPTASYFITLFVLLCAVSAFAASKWPDKSAASIIIALLTAVTAGYMMSLEHLLVLGVGPNLLFATILPASVMALALTPVYPGLPKHRVQGLVLLFFVLATVLALWMRFDPIAATVPVY